MPGVELPVYGSGVQTPKTRDSSFAGNTGLQINYTN